MTLMATLLICDKPKDLFAEDNYDQILYWSSFQQGEDSYSVPKVVDERFEELRARYLEWLYTLGNTPVHGSRLVGFLAVRPGFSMWWMSLLTEKSQWKTTALYDAFRLMAVDEILRHLSLSDSDTIVIAISDKRTQKALASWCSNSGVNYLIESRVRQSISLSVSRLYNMLPYTFQGILYLFYYIFSRWPVSSHVNRGKQLEGGRQISFFSYYFNLNWSELEYGRFDSRYWAALYKQLRNTAVLQNWFHLFFKSKEMGSPGVAARLLANLCGATSERESHQLLDHRMGLKSLFVIIRDYGKIWWKAFRLRSVRDHFRLSQSAIDFWPLFANDWNDSFVGKTAVTNAIYLNLLEERLNALPEQSKGFYLLENQAWERALVYAWRKAGHGTIIGVQHATVSPCDLRHFFSPKEYSNNASCPLPVPDYVAVNGGAARQQYLAGEFPMEQLVGVEGLRYLYLGTQKQSAVAQRVQNKSVRLLVLGDYLPHITRKQMQLLVDAAEKFPDNLDILVKSHPACPVDPAEWLSLKFNLTDAPLNQLLDRYDVAYTSNMTGAAVDAYLAGKHVLSMLDPDTFNMSPLRGSPGVEFVVTPQELADAVSGRDSWGVSRSSEKQELFFYTDAELPRWNRLLAS